MTAEPDVFVVGGPDVAWRETGGDIVLLDLAGAVYFGLNGTGAQLWKRLIDGATRADLLDHLSQYTDPEGSRVPDDVDGFLADLDRHGLLRHASKPATVRPGCDGSVDLGA